MSFRSAVSVIVGLSVASAAGAGVGFQRLGLPAGFEPNNPAFSDAYGVANDGTVVGSMYVPNVGFRGFRWTPGGGLEQINGVTPSSGFFARAITPDGSVIVGENTGPGVGARRVGNGALQSLSFPQNGDYDQSALNDVSDNGAVGAGLLSRVADATFRAARWAEGSGWQDLGVLDEANDYESSANTISADGSIVAGYSVGTNFKAVRWVNGVANELASPYGPGRNAAVIAMSATGNVYGGQANDEAGASHGVAWFADGSSQVLDLLSGYSDGAAFAVSGDGSLLAGAVSNVGEIDRAVFWSLSGGVTDLKDYLVGNGVDLTGWSLTAITEISQNGVYFAGRGLNPDGQLESFVVTIPAPGAGAVSLGVMVLLARRRR